MLRRLLKFDVSPSKDNASLVSNLFRPYILPFSSLHLNPLSTLVYNLSNNFPIPPASPIHYIDLHDNSPSLALMIFS